MHDFSTRSRADLPDVLTFNLQMRALILQLSAALVLALEYVSGDKAFRRVSRRKLARPKSSNIDNANDAFAPIHYRAHGLRRKRKSDNVKFLNL